MSTPSFKQGARCQAPPILVEVSAGELLDKISVLRIKSRRIEDPGKLANVRTELDVLELARRGALSDSPDVADLLNDLTAVNEELWDVIARIYDHEYAADFGPLYVELARSVYRLNDRRALLKRRINLLVGSRLVEEKAHDIGSVKDTSW